MMTVTEASSFPGSLITGASEGEKMRDPGNEVVTDGGKKLAIINM